MACSETIVIMFFFGSLLWGPGPPRKLRNRVLCQKLILKLPTFLGLDVEPRSLGPHAVQATRCSRFLAMKRGRPLVFDAPDTLL